ncbi:17180_t:CDS:1, partial [Racocetra persica]
IIDDCDHKSDRRIQNRIRNMHNFASKLEQLASQRIRPNVESRPEKKNQSKPYL